MGIMREDKGIAQELLNLFEMICHGRSFSEDGGKISSIQLPAIRYFAYFITKVLRPLASPSLPFAARAPPPGELSPLLRQTSLSFAARRILAVLPSRPQHWCFVKLFSASPSPDFLGDCELAAPPANFFLSNSTASG
ncbi:hypothetical protein QYE76_070269 [Lolium multiflorum]|uniref:Uncharacterized protein n=1 Tax=Lolium multiflorum TaxID=4521 RepID=A0AAD8SIW4_LOLMU|nr:hypothetical protein QYE76_070269 [Lolium multiflorum]